MNQPLQSDFGELPDASLEEVGTPHRSLAWGELSLFWRTFFLLALLLLGSILAWLQTLRALEFERPFVRATNTGATAIIDYRGRVTHSLPRLTRGALHHRENPGGQRLGQER